MYEIFYVPLSYIKPSRLSTVCMPAYFKKHIEKADMSKSKPYEIIENPSIDDFLNMVRMGVNE